MNHFERLQSFRDRNRRFLVFYGCCAGIIGVALDILTGYDAILPSPKLMAISLVLAVPASIAIAFLVTLVRWLYFRARAVFRLLDALN
jgi:hypothetical protein